jgi:hypothetical protein
MTILLVALLTGPCIYWTDGIDSRGTLQAAGVKQICVEPGQVEAWRAAGFQATAISDSERAAREVLTVPGIGQRAGVASPPRAPWVNANGWRFIRKPDGKYVYNVPVGKAGMAAAEAYAYGADALLEIDSEDLASAGAMLRFLEILPDATLPPLADLAIVDDGTTVTGEVMNLLTRRNLPFQIVKAPSPQFPLTIRIGSPEYPAAEAADPSAFALKIRRQLTDERRVLRIFGSEVVIGRLTGDGSRVRLHLINYGGRDIEGLRVRVRGSYREGDAHVFGAGRVPLQDFVAADGATEFSIPKLSTYAVVDLR